MVPPVEFTLHIDAYTPETIPMERLATYLLEWAVLMGETQSVHFLEVKPGSVRPVAHVAWEAAPKVRKRIAEARANEGPAEPREAKRRIDLMLVQDNASATLLESRPNEEPAKILYFPGAKASAAEYPPFQQPGTLTGIPIVIGGENDPVPVHLQDRDAVYNCRASRDIAKDLAPFLFTTAIRVTGMGTWVRSAEGAWEMRRFLIQSYAKVREESVSEAATRLHAVGGRVQRIRDPIRELRSIQSEPPPRRRKARKR
jgi:hypothetical protein